MGLLLLSGTLAASAAPGVREQLQKGIYEQEINYNLQAASASFEGVLRELEPERIIAANALSRLAEIQQKLGKTNEAHASRLRLVRDFSDQTNLIAAAARVDPAIISTASPSDEPSQEARELKARAISIVNRLKAESGTRRRIYAAQVGGQELKQSMQTIDKFQLEIINLSDFGPKHPEMLKAQAKLKQAESQMDDHIDAMLHVLEQDPAMLRLMSSSKESESEEDKELKRIQTLIKESPDLINDRSSAPLNAAAFAGQPNVVKLLLDNGADPNLISASFTTPLYTAVTAGRKDMVELLLSRGADVNKIMPKNQTLYTTALEVAAFKGFTSIAQYLIEKGADVNSGNISPTPPLMLAIKQKRLLIAQLLLAKGANPNVRGKDDQSPLTIALQLEWPEMVELLLAKHVEVNTTHLSLGILDYQPPVQPVGDYNKLSLLGIAAAIGNSEILQILLKAGADPKGATNCTPPLISSLKHPGISELLVKRGADPNARTPDGFKILDSVSRRFYAATNQIETLLNIGANPLERDEKNEIAVHHAPPENAMILVKWMVEHRVDLNGQYSKGDTLLHFAVRKSNEAMVKLLVDGGVELNTKNDDGLTPLDLAVRETFIHPHNWGDTDIPVLNPYRKIIDSIHAKGGHLTDSICFISGRFNPTCVHWPNGTDMDLETALHEAKIQNSLTSVTVKREGQLLKIDRTQLVANNKKFPLMDWDELIVAPPTAPTNTKEVINSP
ncbi:MAG: Ankyrin repeat protein [Verrucomicrobiales bacterium]|nr:Ankyrin repeat protein [Verrucomicrobiales bacterium]